MMTFRTIRYLLSPRWLTDGDGGLVGYSLDLVKDAFVERCRQGLLIRFPQQDKFGTPAPADALAAIGLDRHVVRGINESATSYSKRLLRWLDDALNAGNPFALMAQLSAYCGGGLVLRTVDSTGNWFTRNADGSASVLINQGNWNWDGPAAGRWSRFWVIIYPPSTLWTTGGAWGAGQTWGVPGATWGTTATQDQVKSVQGIVRDWKPAGTTCVNIIIAFDPNSFNPTSPEPDGNWGTWAKNVGGVMVASRLSTARYWDGV